MGSGRLFARSLLQLRKNYSGSVGTVPLVKSNLRSDTPIFTEEAANWFQKRHFAGSGIMSSSNKYKLYYFNFRVIGEPIRWQFALAKVPYEDIRIPRDRWEPDYKDSTGFGRLPLLKIDDSVEITQSAAISRLLAKEFNLLAETPLLQCRCDELVDNLQDLRLLWRPWVRESDPTKKAVLAKEMVEVNFPFYLPKVEQFVKAHGKDGYAVGNKLTWADLYLANFMQIWTENHGKDLLANCPTLEKHMNKIINIPEIKEWIEKRPKTGF